MIMTYLKKPYSYIWCASVGLILLALIVGFVPQREGLEIRRHVSNAVVKLALEDMPKPIVNDSSWSMRFPVNSNVRSTTLNNENNNKDTNAQWLNFAQNHITLHTAQGLKSVENNTFFASLMNALPTGESMLSVVQPVSYGEAISANGQPVRWAMKQRDNIACSIEQTSLERMHRSLVAHIALPPRNESTKAKIARYRDLVRKAAQRFNLSEALLFAIIQTESSFSPALVSSQSAMGLMQLLPSTAGGEVHRFLHGHSATMTLEDLSNPEVNILFGSAYVHLLLTRHLGGVKDEKSRLYCALAAYNMGPGRLIRFFGSGPEDAIANINKLEAHEVYTRLTTVLPIAETRAYVAKVTNRQAQFEDIL